MQIKRTRLLRYRKYLIPVELPKFRPETEPAPTGIATLTELAKKFPDQVRLQDLTPQLPVSDHQPWQFRVVSKRNAQYRNLTSPMQQAVQIAAIKNGASVGRSCCLIGPANHAVIEAGFHFDVNVLVNSLKLGRFHPYLRRYRAQGDLRTRATLPVATHISGTVAALNNRAAHNFYHWLIEIAPRIAAIELAGIEPDYFLIDCQSGFQKSILAMLGIRPERVLQPHSGLHVRSDEMIFVPETNVAVLKHFVAMLEKCIQWDASAQRRLYISRRQARNRKIVNEIELERFLVANGFESVCFEDLTVADQFRLMRESATVVTAHGAALANTIFARPGTNIVEIFPQSRSNLALYPGLSQSMGLQHISILGEYTPLWRNIRVDMRDIEFALEQLAYKKFTCTSVAA